ncbi:MAG: hypothetical protein HC842_07380 [Cytophagales bacterium]|nr:hypothetical protein [Cytophagales bacterium]
MKINHLLLALGFCLFFGLTACDNTEDDENSCTGCEKAAPYGHSSKSGQCYATASECETALGMACELCD